jgi:multidrug efflux pump subunit AcrB
MSLAAFGVRKPVVANLVMFAIIGAGIIFGLSLRREFFPESEARTVIINAPYPGASPDEVEQTLAVKIEDAVADLDDVKELTSQVSEGIASITIEFRDGIDIDEKLFEVKREMDALQDLPEESERIIVDKFEPNLPVCVLSIYGDADERTMKNAIREIRDDLETLPGMGDIVISGVRTDEVTVEVAEHMLLQHGLSLPNISDAISQAMRELPAGSVRSSTMNTAVRTVGVDDRIEEIRNIIVKAGNDQALRLGEIATVTAGFADVDLRTRLNGEPSVSLTVYKVGKQDAVEMADMVKAYKLGREVAAGRAEPITYTAIEFLKSKFRRPGDTTPPSPRIEAYELGLSRVTPPPGELAITTDLARFIVGRLDLLTRNALAGGALVLLVLVLLLNLRVAFWTAVGLGVSLLGTLAAMSLLGYTLNLLTMFGLIIVVGLLVDDAIVVAENITRRFEEGDDPDTAAVDGTNQVNWPVVATIITTICAFLPLALIEGQIGDLLGALPVVVACALLVSLIEALFILPVHMAHSLHKHGRHAEGEDQTLLARAEATADRYRTKFFSGLLIPLYTRTIRVLLRARYLTVAAALSMLILCFGLVAGGVVEATFLESSDAETVNIELQMPIGTPVDQTDEIVRRIEAAATAQEEISAVFAQVGALNSIDGGSESSQQSHVGQVILELKPVEQRDRSSEQVINAVRERIGDVPGVKSLRIEELAGGPGGPPITLTVVGDNPDRIAPVVAKIKEYLAEYEGVRDIADNADSGRREIQITLKDVGRELGFTQTFLGRQIRAAIFGLEAYTFAGIREDVDVRVMLPTASRRSLETLENIRVFSPVGTPVPLSEVAELRETEGFATIRRLDRQRAISVTAEANRAIVNPEELIADLRPRLNELQQANPGIRILERGRQQDNAESLASLPIGMLVAIGLIYFTLAWLFGSYAQPFIVLSAVPFAAIGMILGHMFLGFTMTILSFIGFIALSGIVVNDSLIYMSFYNRLKDAGLHIEDACVETGRARLRAILLTTVTTVLGLLPLLLEQSFQARFLIPMAITIAGGLISATMIILVVLPCLLMIFDDMKRVAHWAWSGGGSPIARPAPTGHGLGTLTSRAQDGPV